MESPSVPLAKDHHYAITIVVNVVYRFYGGWFDLSVGIVSVVIQRTKPILVSVDAKWIGRGKFIGNAIAGCRSGRPAPGVYLAHGCSVGRHRQVLRPVDHFFLQVSEGW